MLALTPYVQKEARPAPHSTWRIRDSETPVGSTRKVFSLGAIVMSGSTLLAEESVRPALADDNCAVSDVTYSVVTSFLLRDTEFGAGTGVRPLGAGKLVLRYERAADGSSTRVKVMSYEVDNHMIVNANVAMWSTRVVTDSHTSVLPACDGNATGSMSGEGIVWNSAVRGYHSDGTLQCAGNACGKFGAPPVGTSPLHETQVFTWKPFRFNSDGHAFTMEYTKVAHSDSPKHTDYLALSGREVGRVCVARPATCR
jgi:hypothetical protein